MGVHIYFSNNHTVSYTFSVSAMKCLLVLFALVAVVCVQSAPAPAGSLGWSYKDLIEYYKTISAIVDKLRELRHDVMCGQSASGLISALGMPDDWEEMVLVAQEIACETILQP